MVLEIAEIEVLPDSTEEFTAAYLRARHLILEAGAESVRLLGGIESPRRFRLLVEWESPKVHADRFTSQPAWRQWRAAVGPYFARSPVVEHYELVPAAES